MVRDIGFINGTFCPLEASVLPIEERGANFGDGVYEVIRCVRGNLELAEEHFARLARSCARIRLSNPYTDSEWMTFIREGLSRTGLSDAQIYLQITRGVAPRKHGFPDCESCATMTIKPLTRLDQALYEGGVSAILTEDIRWALCSIKSLNLLPNVLAKQEAQDAGAFEAIFTRDGYVTEGSSSNVFIVRRGTLYTHPANDRILHGVTRNYLLACARETDIPVVEEAYPVARLGEADEVFLTSSITLVMPVRTILGTNCENRTPGPITATLARAHASLSAEGK